MATEKETLRQEKDDLLWVMSTTQGRRFMWRMLSQCGVYHEHEGEAQQVFKQEGKRSIGLFLLGITADASEELSFTMMREAKNKATEEKIQNDNSSNTTSSADGKYSTTTDDDHFDYTGLTSASTGTSGIV